MPVQLPLSNVNKEAKNSLTLQIAPSRYNFSSSDIFNYCLSVEYISQDEDRCHLREAFV